MKYLFPILTSLCIFYQGALIAQEASAIQASMEHEISNPDGTNEDCSSIIRIESPSADTYTSLRADTVNFGHEISMRLRGTPEKKSMMSHLTFAIADVAHRKISRCYLKLYTVSKQSESTLSLYSSHSGIDEASTTWASQPMANILLGTKVLSDDPYQEFEVTQYVVDQLPASEIHFCIRSDSKKPIAISSRESGLGSELIIEYCSGQDEDIYGSAPKEKYGMQVLPNAQEGKLTIELRGVPAGGFGDLMFMDEQGAILRQVPMAIRNAKVLQHSLDYGDLLPGIYWAVFRKGRIMVRDQFRLQPSKDQHRLLEIAADHAKPDH